MIENTPFRPGQSFDGEKLYFTLEKNPRGEPGPWVIDSSSEIFLLKDLHVKAPHLMPTSGLRKVLIQLNDPRLESEERTALEHLLRTQTAVGHARWRAESIQHFCDGAKEDAKALYLRLLGLFQRFFFAPDPVHYVLCVLYLMASYLFTTAETIPYLHFIGEPASGKTVLAGLFNQLGFNARQAASISSAAIYRFIEHANGLLLLDEQSHGDRQWRRILLAGYRRSGQVLICGSGEHDLIELSCFGLKVLLTNDALNDPALESRVIQVATERARTPLERYHSQAVELEAVEHRDALYTFAMQNAKKVFDEYRALPRHAGVTHRSEDLGALLWAVARVVDRSPGEELSLYDQLVQFMESLERKQKAIEAFDSERTTIAAHVIEFVDGSEVEPVISEAKRADSFFLAEDFATSLNKSRQLRPMRPKEIGERLNRWKLITEQKRVELTHSNIQPGKVVSATSKPPARIQRRAYKFNIEQAKQLAGGLP